MSPFLRCIVCLVIGSVIGTALAMLVHARSPDLRERLEVTPLFVERVVVSLLLFSPLIWAVVAIVFRRKPALRAVEPPAVGSLVRRRRLPAVLCLLLAIMAYPIYQVLAVLHVWVLCAAVLGRGFLAYDRGLWSAGIFYGLLAGSVIGGVLLSRSIYLRLRWRMVEYDSSYCLTCGYNLTGNTSGICPECGQPTTNQGADT